MIATTRVLHPGVGARTLTIYIPPRATRGSALPRRAVLDVYAVMPLNR